MARLTDVLSRQHQQLAELVSSCVDASGALNLPAFERFRRLQLQHVSVEAQVVVPAVMRAARLPPAFQNGVRKDHEALVVHCLTAPEPEFVHDLRELLLWHQKVEEQPGGLFDLFDRHVGDDPAVERAAAALPAFEPPPFVSGAPVAAVLRQVLQQLGLAEPARGA